MTKQTPATAEIEKWLRIRSVFPKFLTPGPDQGPKEKRRILPESTQVIRIRSHLSPKSVARNFGRYGICMK